MVFYTNTFETSSLCVTLDNIAYVLLIFIPPWRRGQNESKLLNRTMKNQIKTNQTRTVKKLVLNLDTKVTVKV